MCVLHRLTRELESELAHSDQTRIFTTSAKTSYGLFPPALGRALEGSLGTLWSSTALSRQWAASARVRRQHRAQLSRFRAERCSLGRACSAFMRIYRTNSKDVYFAFFLEINSKTNQIYIKKIGATCYITFPFCFVFSY